MNIQLLSPIITQKYNNNQKISQNTSVQHSKLSPLNADTVSFGINKNKVVKSAGTKLRDVMIDSYEKVRPKYEIYAKRLMATLELIAVKFKDRGVKFDRKYCEHAAVKSSESFVSKFLRSGEKPLDRVRSTLYVENPHDFKLIDEIISEFENLGYEIANIPGTKNPDFDIRLADVTATELKGLRPELRGCVSNPIPTGYEDIQFRIKDPTHKNAPAMEVLIIFGEKTANAKIDESKYSYNIRRALKNLLHANKVENPEVNTPAYRIRNNTKIICDTLSSAISKPLFINAKNADYLHDSFSVPVELGEKTCEALTGMLEGIRDKIPKHYYAESRRIRSVDYGKEIVKLIKSSPAYKEREDKTIYAVDIIEKQKELLAELREHKEEDLKLIQEIQTALEATIKKYGPQSPAQKPKTTKSPKS